MINPIQALQEQRRLLQIEYEEEKRTFSELTTRIGFARLAEHGNAWMPVSVGRVFYNSLNQRVLEVSRLSSGEEDLDHNFEYGRPVVFFTLPVNTASANTASANTASANTASADTASADTASANTSKPSFPFSGTVSFVDGDRMVVVIPESADVNCLSSASVAGVMLSFDETSYRTMFDAIDRTIKAKGRLAELRDLIYSRRKAAELSFAPLGFPYLNPSQQKAVNKVLCSKDVAVVHGPPGTGKTTTLVEAIAETLRREPQVLVCAQSNMAVDWICERLVDRGVHVLRLGNPSRVNDKMLSFTYERRFESHPDYPDLWSIRKAIRELRAAKRRGSDQWHQKMDRLRSRATELEVRINQDLFNSAHVIASTLVGSASRLLDGMRFSTLFIDEAAQALEAASWIPMRRVGRVVLAGDHCQLPPTVKSFEAMKAGLGKSLMERIVDNHPEAVTLLTMQYRMNHEIMRFSNEWFYGGAMTAAPEVRHRGILDFDTPIEWIDPKDDARHSEWRGVPPAARCDQADDREPTFQEALAGESHGRINKDEAEFAVRTLWAYIEKISKRRFLDERIDVGLISPYRAQVLYLRGLIKRTPFFKPFRHLISVNTVDGFQGQERDVIVISLVRSNDAGDIGFLRDLRRMNVAMTRARMKLIIIGSIQTLTRHPFYRKLLKEVHSVGRIAEEDLE